MITFLHEIETTDAAGRIAYEFCLVEYKREKIQFDFSAGQFEGGAIEEINIYNKAGQRVIPGVWDMERIYDKVFYI